MKIYNYVLIISFIFLTLSCSVTKRQQQGYVLPETFDYKTNFTTAKSVIILPVEINGIMKNFLFDTGGDLTLIQRDTILGKTEKISGASNRKIKIGNELVKSFKIGNVNFENTVAWNGDFVGLKEQIPNFGGLIGQPIISKANWLIDYPNKNIQFSDKNLIDNSFQSIDIKREDGAPYIKLMIGGKEYKAIIDLGSSATLSIPKDSKLAKVILNTYNFKDNEREIYSVGGLQKVKEKIGVIPLIKIGDIDFLNVKTDIRHTSQLRVGNKFFKDYKVYIDNIKNNYSLKKGN
jgi:hypothetical protein